jgi:hypothetical protein
MSILGPDSIDQVLAQKKLQYWSTHSQLALAMLVFTDLLDFECMYNPLSSNIAHPLRSGRNGDSRAFDITVFLSLFAANSSAYWAPIDNQRLRRVCCAVPDGYVVTGLDEVRGHGRPPWRQAPE